MRPDARAYDAASWLLLGCRLDGYPRTTQSFNVSHRRPSALLYKPTASGLSFLCCVLSALLPACRLTRIAERSDDGKQGVDDHLGLVGCHRNIGGTFNEEEVHNLVGRFCFELFP
jgi:hypothetical protein